MFDKKTYLSLYAKDFIGALQYLCNEIPNSLFKFYSLGNGIDEIKLNTLKENKIWVELFKNQNDPFEMINLDIDVNTVEPKHLASGEILIDKEHLASSYQNHMNHYKNTIKTASFCDVMVTNISMWAYYTNNHQGFCCEYEPISRDLDAMKPLRPVLYEKDTVQTKATFVEHLVISGMNSLIDDSKQAQYQQLYNLELIKMLASCKDISWEHEREFRALYFGEESGCGETVMCSELNVRLKAIYSGIRCSEENKLKLRTIAENLGVEFHEMKASPTDYLLFE